VLCGGTTIRLIEMILSGVGSGERHISSVISSVHGEEVNGHRALVLD
jgi:hypothetical protein